MLKLFLFFLNFDNGETVLGNAMKKKRKKGLMAMENEENVREGREALLLFRYQTTKLKNSKDIGCPLLKKLYLYCTEKA